MDLGPPISYMGLSPGVAVLSADGDVIGEVAHVLADEREDVFDGIVIVEPGQPHSHHLGHPHPHSHRFADADDVQEIHERGVVLKLSSSDCRALPEPSANPAVMREDPSNPPAHGLDGKLRRAWDRISGNY